MKNKQTKINYVDLWGLREEKYKFLEKHDVKNTKWQKLSPKEPNYFFVSKDTKGEDVYNGFISLEEIFNKYNAGIATGKDDVLVDFDKQALKRKLSTDNKTSFEVLMQNYGVSKNLIDLWYQELEKGDIEDQIKTYNYRPFDNRFTIYNSKIIQRARKEIMDNFLNKNVALCMTNTCKNNNYNEIFISEGIVDKHLTGHQTYVFPLYLYLDRSEQKMIINGQGKLDLYEIQHALRIKNDKNSNIKEEFFIRLRQKLGMDLSPEEVFYYIYAVLYSNVYRQKYQEFLKIDFPRIPFTKNYNLFKALAQRGEQLVNLHHLKSKELENPSVKFYGRGDNSAEKREWKDNQVWINNRQYFAPIKEEVWRYYIGGYQVLDKWLKERKGRVLSSEDIKHYCKVATAISKTIKIQKEIDKLYPEVEKNLII